MHLLRQMTGISVILAQLINNTVKNKRRWRTKPLKNIQVLPTVPQEGLSVLKFAFKKNGEIVLKMHLLPK